MGVIVALIPNPVRLQRLQAAVRELHTIIPCDGWEAVLATAEQRMPHLAVLDLEAAGAPNFDPVRKLRRMAPRIALIAYVGLGPDRLRHVFDAGRFGFDELVVADLDDRPSFFARAIEKAGARGVASMLREALPSAGNSTARDALMVAVTRANEAIAPMQLAKIVGVSPRQLSRRLDEARYPSAARLLMWGRLIVAAGLMDDTRHSADQIARMLRFPSGSAFRNVMRRYLSARPSEIRDGGGALQVVRALRQEIDDAG